MGHRQAIFLVVASFLIVLSNAVAAVPVLMNGAAQVGAPRRLRFSGYEWVVKSSRGPVGPGPNVFSEENVEVDDDGQLRLKIARRGGRWTSAEIGSRRDLGYGTYRFSVAAGPRDPRAILGLFTWSDHDDDAHHREIDIEIGRWGDADGPNAQCTVQPSSRPGNLIRFELPDGPAVHEFNWSRSGISCRSQIEASAGSALPFVHRHQFRESAPPAGTANVRINLWLADGLPPSNDGVIEAIVQRFEYFPEP